MTSDRLRIARAVARAAADTALEFHRDRSLRSWAKDDGSVVTEADLATEERIRRVLAELAPGEAVLGEEYGLDGAPAEGCWVVDPIDGTENFRRAGLVWGTLVAWCSGSRPVAAVVSAPSLGRTWWAERGRGAHTDGRRRLSVSRVAELSEASFAFGGAHEYPPRELARLTAYAATCRTAWGIGNFLGHVQVAEGAVDGALSHGARIWDLAAPALVVEEARGEWSDLDGRPDLGTGTLLTTNGTLHRTLLAGVGAALGPSPADRTSEENHP
ncbi:MULTISPECIES: inositol monophosphatase family protein [Kitasatospora]|uniref:Putative inositol monophosphatase n=1 Tax=Kitasatospora setae (strain ATCC 33774 / DSM 43861 / JCM 3304 / KCC A-0304 / NBRC 14216 / KM-6054) TaxID=452652 RepID=E4N9N4_KITSK|nr:MULTISPECIES: inositol monophosphatase family protein [Kitasatospora]BAJ27915.1 putative inositol monophosphatase [Kitasatospora setae KM-6054]